ncbi:MULTISPECIES: hypothetical protein [unclassified Cryobacterium]|uniref:hypothetical protein n=1 Tax=unclassified Cryobacterium TaxID=2649013 RepID=UPI00141AEB92|nr:MULTISPECIES: hypothetical protein [unclassified Cryobacterium]
MSNVPDDVTAMVDGRDEQKCTRCGVWISDNGSRHHRMRRAVGGHLVENIILLCGSGSSLCHGWAHSHPAAAILAGYIIPTWIEDIAEVPLQVHTPGVNGRGNKSWMVLTTAGQREHLPTVEAMHRLERIPMLTEHALAEEVAALRRVGGSYAYVADSIENQNEVA